MDCLSLLLKIHPHTPPEDGGADAAAAVCGWRWGMALHPQATPHNNSLQHAFAGALLSSCCIMAVFVAGFVFVMCATLPVCCVVGVVCLYCLCTSGRHSGAGCWSLGWGRHKLRGFVSGSVRCDMYCGFLFVCVWHSKECTASKHPLLLRCRALCCCFCCCCRHCGIADSTGVLLWPLWRFCVCVSIWRGCLQQAYSRLCCVV